MKNNDWDKTNPKDIVKLIDNIIEKAIETVRRETEAENPITGENYKRRSNTDDFPHVALPKDNVIDKDKGFYVVELKKCR